MSLATIKNSRAVRWGLRLAISLIILVGMVFAVARLSLPFISNYQSEIENLATDVLQHPVSIDELEATWSGLNPVIVMRGVHVNDESDTSTGLDLKELDIAIDIPGSILSASIKPKVVTVKISRLDVLRSEQGRISFDLDLLTDESSEDKSEFDLRWILEQPDVHVLADKLIYTDQQHDIPQICIHDASLSFKKRTDALVVNLNAEACDIAENLRLSFHLPLESLNQNHLSADFYLQLNQLSLNFWREVLSDYVTLPQSGNASMKLWGKLDSGKLAQLDGNLLLDSVVYSLGQSQLYQLDRMAVNFNWQRNDQGWQLQLADWELSMNRHEWPGSGLQVVYDQQLNQFDIRSPYLRIDDLLPILTAQHHVKNMLEPQWLELKPAGVVKNLNLRLSLDDSLQLQDYAVNAWLENFSMHASGEIPGMRGIDGRLVATSQAGMLELNTSDAMLNLTTLFRDPLRLNRLHGRLNWSVLPQGVLIEASDLTAENSHITTQSRLLIHLAKDSAPFVDIQTNFKNGDGAYTSFYLPAKIMHPDAVQWLDSGIVSGHVDYGTFVMHGNVEDFPFDEGEGRFEVRFHVQKGILDYYENWPRIDEIEAEVLFLGRGMTINATEGKIFDANIQNVQVAIPDLNADNPLLSIDGSAKTSSDDLLRYLTETSLAGDYQAALSALELGGQHDFNLNLTIPLSEGDIQFNGKLDFKENYLRVPDWNILLSKVTGELQFNQNEFLADNLKADFKGEPVDGNVETVQNNGLRETHINLTTETDFSQLLAQKNPQLAEQIQGDSIIRVSIEVPDDLNQSSRLNVVSDLVGTELRFPAPFIKSKDESLPLQIVTGLGGKQESQIQLSLQDKLYLDIQLNDVGEMASGVLTIGEQGSVQPQKNNRFLISGSVAEVDVENWLNWYKGIEVESSGDTGSQLPVDINLQIDRLKYLKWSQEDFRITGSIEDQLIDFVLSGDSAEGTMQYFFDEIDRLQLSLNRLVLNKEQGAEINQADNDQLSDIGPADIPSLNIKIDELIYDTKEIGGLVINTESSESQVTIHQANINSTDSRLNTSGQWVYRNNQHQTDLSFDIESDDFGALMKRLGYEDTIRKGKASLKGQLSAPLSPINLSVADLSGSIDISVKEGEVVEVDPGGAGRIFGLLSFQTLPRRLSLDFRDLFNKGLSFDDIDGSFTLSDGNAYTNDLTMSAPSSTVEISGRVGLLDEDYDQMVRVIPNVSSSLPVAGALAGGPGLAVVLLITHQLLEDPINKLTGIEYQISGPWAEPNVEKLAAASKSDENVNPSDAAQ